MANNNLIVDPPSGGMDNQLIVDPVRRTRRAVVQPTRARSIRLPRTPNLVVDPVGPSSNNLVVDPVPNTRTAAGIYGNAGVSVNKLYNTY